MRKGLKILAGIGCVLILIGAVGIGLFIIGLNYIESRLGESNERFETEGREFGARTDQQGCINEGLHRSRLSSPFDFSEGMATLAFTEACLKSSRPTLGFCDEVPSYSSSEDGEWKIAQCYKASMDEHKTGCTLVFKAKHNHCSGL